MGRGKPEVRWFGGMDMKLFLVALLLPGMFHCAWGKSNRLPRILSFACYYGQGKVAELSQYPLVILEARNYSKEEIRKIQKQGTIVIGYLSLGEILEEPVGLEQGFQSSSDPALAPYYLDGDKDGKPDRNGAWGSLYVDARSPQWQSKVLNRLIPLLLKEKGVDGLFLDTLDTVDVYPQTRTGMIQLVLQIRKNHPQIPLIANRGFSILEGLLPEVDAFLFEAFSTRWDPASGRSTLHAQSDLDWVDSVLERIRSQGGRGGPQVLVLDYADKNNPGVMERAVAHARRAGLAYSISTGSLDQLPIDGGPERPRPKP